MFYFHLLVLPSCKVVPPPWAFLYQVAGISNVIWGSKRLWNHQSMCSSWIIRMSLHRWCSLYLPLDSWAIDMHGDFHFLHHLQHELSFLFLCFFLISDNTKNKIICIVQSLMHFHFPFHHNCIYCSLKNFCRMVSS